MTGQTKSDLLGDKLGNIFHRYAELTYLGQKKGVYEQAGFLAKIGKYRLPQGQEMAIEAVKAFPADYSAYVKDSQAGQEDGQRLLAEMRELNQPFRLGWVVREWVASGHMSSYHVAFLAVISQAAIGGNPLGLGAFTHHDTHNMHFDDPIINAMDQVASDTVGA